MAKQHFYSRVPARMSLFNKMDGFDTFAHSDGLGRELMVNELSVVCDNKLTKEETALIQKGAMPNVYCQFMTGEGVLSQSAVSYHTSDYTGERSSYMVHTLLLSDEEKKAHLEDQDNAVFDPDIFKYDLDGFDLVSFDARPITDYPEIDVPAKKIEDTSAIAKDYDTGMMKRLIYSLVGIACGKTKALYLCFNTPVSEFSQRALGFLNEVFLIFPYHLRKYFSFVTYVGEFSKYNSFKIKCMPESAQPAPTAKGVTLKMDYKDYVGISDDNVAANSLIVDFFFELLSKDDIRREFIKFCEYAVSKNEQLLKPSLKNLGDLVLLFKALSGFYAEKAVLPNDDAVYNYICVYEKYRSALMDGYRVKSFDFLERYSAGHTAIPKNVFNKVSNLYPCEAEQSKQTAMNVILSLIHTDAMREKLFAFVRSNYDSEDESTRAVIMENICRVYYGGFLQKPIIEFFEEHFENEPDVTRNNIVERLLLTIRTPAIQENVIGFINKFYPIFTESEKSKFYQIFFDMLPEADGLSRLLCDTVDLFIEEPRKKEVADKIIKCVERDEKKQESALCSAITTKCGFCESVVAAKVFSDWSSRKIFGSFVSAVCKKGIGELADTVIEIWQSAPDMSADASDRLLDAISENFGNYAKAGVFDLIQATDKIASLKACIPQSVDFTDKLCSSVLQPAVSKLIPTSFDHKRYPDGINKITALAADRKYISDSQSYECISEFNGIIAAIDGGKASDILPHCEKITGKPVRTGAAEHIKTHIKNLELSEIVYLVTLIAIDYLVNDELRFIDPASKLRDLLSKKAYSSGSDGTDPSSVDDGALRIVIDTGALIYTSGITDELKNSLLSDNSDLVGYLQSYINKYEKKGKKALLSAIDIADAPNDYKEFLRSSVNGYKQSGGGLFKKLFFKQ